MKKFIFSHLIGMRYFLMVLCCITVIPGMAYAQSDVGTLQIEQEQYILERAEDVLVKIFGSVQVDQYEMGVKVMLTHTAPDGESLVHNIRINNEGYFEFYFVHDWKSIRGNYDVAVSKGEVPIGTVSYELIQDPSYKTDEEVKKEYLTEGNDTNVISDKDVLNIPKKIPDWVKNVFGWYYMDRITEEEVISAIQYLVKNEIIKLD